MRFSLRGHSTKTSVFASLLILIMASLFYLGNELMVKRTPLVKAADKIAIHTTTAHLWFEEILSGDRNESIEAVWSHLDLADQYSTVLLEDGTIKGDVFYSLTDPAMREKVLDVKNKLSEFRAIADIRYEKRISSFAGSALDEQFDTLFLRLTQSLDELVDMIEIDYAKETKRYQTTSIVLIVISIFGALALLRRLRSQENYQRKLLNSLTAAKEAIEEKNRHLHRQAHFDALTGLPNRVLLLDRLERAMLLAERNNKGLAALFIDLDHFKEVNDRYGHHIGDKLLIMVAKRIQSSLRATDTAARISGDEFMVVLEGLADIPASVAASDKIAALLIQAMSEPYHIDQQNITISASIGIALHQEDAINVDELIRYADKAMYHAKSQGKNNYQFYSSNINEQLEKASGFETELRAAISNEEFVVHYQPRWNFSTEKISGVEAFLRWNHPEKGLIFPDDFIPVAEKTGLISDIDRAMTQIVLMQLESWQSMQFNVGIVSINLSTVSLNDPSFVTDFCSFISESEADVSQLEIDVKEQVFLDEKYSHHTINRLKRLGVRISLDSFGADESSINSLKNFNINTLKIHRSYTHTQACDKTVAIILESIINLANQLGIEVVAEGIETSEQKRRLVSIGCKSGQGFMLTKPMEAKELEQYKALKSPSNVVHLKRS